MVSRKEVSLIPIMKSYFMLIMIELVDWWTDIGFVFSLSV